MSGHDFTLIAAGGTFALLALLSWLLWRDHRGMLAAKTAIAMNLGIAAYVFQTTGWTEQRTLDGLVISTLARSTPALFWLFARVWFNDRTRLAWWEALLVGLSVLNSLAMHFSYQVWPNLFTVSAVLFRAAMFGYAGAGLWEAWRGREGDLIEGRRRIRLALIGVVGAYVMTIAFAEMAVYNARAPYLVITLIGSSTMFATLALCAAMFASRQADMFGASLKPEARPQPSEDNPLAESLFGFMEAEMPHRDEGLTIAALAARLGEQEYRLRRLINGQLGHRNFAQFLNGYRLAEVKAALADPSQREVPILTIALDAGFGSLGPFNRAFRDAEGMTPSEYRARALSGSLADSGIG